MSAQPISQTLGSYLYAGRREDIVPLDGATPIPGARQTVRRCNYLHRKVVRPRAVESVPEEVRENFFDETIDRTELLSMSP